MDINLDTLKREILNYLEGSEFAVFYGSPGGLEGMSLILWDAEKYPDYQMFLEAARKAGTRLVVFASAEFEAADIDELSEQLEDAEVPRDEQRELESRLREFNHYEGQTCSLELAFDYQGRLYVYEVRPDWYEEFLNLEEEISVHLPDDEDDESMGGYFSRN